MAIGMKGFHRAIRLQQAYRQLPGPQYWTGNAAAQLALSARIRDALDRAFPHQIQYSYHLSYGGTSD